MNRIAIIDPFSSGQFIAGECLARGVEPIAVISGAEVPTSFARSYFPENFVAELRIANAPISEVASKLRSLNCTMVIAGGCDSGVVEASQLAHALGAPGNDPLKLGCLRDKFLMQECIRDHGLRHINGVKVSSAAEARAWLARQASSAFVVKPLRSAVTDGVSFCWSAEEAARAVERLIGSHDVFGSLNQAALVQEYVHGTEYVVDTVSGSGITYVTATLRYKKEVRPDGSILYSEEVFIDPSDDEVQLVTDYARQVVDALGILFGAAHLEIMLAEDGPVLVEVGARLHGTLVPRHLQKICNVSQLELLLDAALDPEGFKEKTRQPAKLIKHSKTVWLSSDRFGVVEAIPGKAWAVTLASYYSAIWNIDIDQQLQSTKTLLDSPGCIFLAHDDPRVLDLDTARIRHMENNAQLWKLRNTSSGDGRDALHQSNAANWSHSR